MLAIFLVATVTASLLRNNFQIFENAYPAPLDYENNWIKIGPIVSEILTRP